MKKLISFVIYLLLLLFTSPAAATFNCNDPSIVPSVSTSSKFVMVSLKKVRPLQSEVGGLLVERIANKIISKAGTKRIPLLQHIEERARGFALPVIVSPKGEYFLLDSHHGVAAIYRALNLNASSATYPLVKLKIIEDYSNSTNQPMITYDQFVEKLLGPIAEGGKGKGQFPSEFNGLTPAQKFDELPLSFFDLLDNPMRSIVGAVFKDYHVEPKFLKDYIEFDLIHFLEEEGYTYDKGNILSEKNIVAAADLIFGSEKIMNFLYASSLSEKKDQANKDSLKRALAIWNKN